jgi:hypothetical protein
MPQITCSALRQLCAVLTDAEAVLHTEGYVTLPDRLALERKSAERAIKEAVSVNRAAMYAQDSHPGRST